MFNWTIVKLTVHFVSRSFVSSRRQKRSPMVQSLAQWHRRWFALYTNWNQDKKVGIRIIYDQLLYKNSSWVNSTTLRVYKTILLTTFCWHLYDGLMQTFFPRPYVLFLRQPLLCTLEFLGTAVLFKSAISGWVIIFKQTVHYSCAICWQ